MIRRSWITCSVIISFTLILLPKAPAAKHWSTPKKKTVGVRLFAEVPRPRISSFGLNGQEFIAEILSNGSPKLIRLVYEHLYYEPPLSSLPLDPTIEYRMRVIRDMNCEAARRESFATTIMSRASDKRSATFDSSLECYSTSAADIKSQRRAKQVVIATTSAE